MTTTVSAGLEMQLRLEDEDFRKKLQGVSDAVEELGVDAQESGELMRTSFVAAGAGIVALGGSLFALSQALTEVAGETHVLSQVSQVTITEFQRLSLIIKESGGSLEATGKIILLTRNQLSLLKESIDPSTQALGMLGLAIEDFNGLTIDQSVLKIVEELQKIDDQNLRGALITAIYGDEDGRAIFGLLSADLTSFNDRIDMFTILTDKAGLSSRRFNDELNLLTTSYTNALTNSFADAGVFDSFSDLFSDLNSRLNETGAFDNIASVVKVLTDNVDVLIDGLQLLAGLFISSFATDKIVKTFASVREEVVKNTNANLDQIASLEKKISVEQKTIEQTKQVRATNQARLKDLGNLIKANGILSRSEFNALRRQSASTSGANALLSAQIKAYTGLNREIRSTTKTIESQSESIRNLEADLFKQNQQLNRTTLLSTAAGRAFTFAGKAALGFGIAVARAIPGLLVFQAAFASLDFIFGVFRATFSGLVTGLKFFTGEIKKTEVASLEFIDAFQKANDVLVTFEDGILSIADRQAELAENTKLATDEIERQRKVLEDRRNVITDPTTLFLPGIGEFSPFVDPIGTPESQADANITLESVAKLVEDTTKLVDTTAFELAETAKLLKDLSRANLNQFGGEGRPINIVVDPIAEFRLDERDKREAERAATLVEIGKAALNEFGGIGRDILGRVTDSLAEFENGEIVNRFIDLLRDPLSDFGGSGRDISVSIDKLAEFLDNQRIDDFNASMRANLNEFGGEGSMIEGAITANQLAIAELAEASQFRRESSIEFEVEQVNLFKGSIRDQIRTGFTDLFSIGLFGGDVQATIQSFAKGLAMTVVQRLADSVFNSIADSLFSSLALNATSATGGSGSFSSQSVLGLFSGFLGIGSPAPNPELSPFGGAGPNVSNLGGASSNPFPSSFGGAGITYNNNISVTPSFVQELTQIAAVRPDIFGQATDRFNQDRRG